MGFTHYFPQNRPCPPEAWAKICAAFREAVKIARIPILAGYDSFADDPAIIDDEQIFFNGIGDAGCETMALDRDAGREFNACKTERLPYDLLVTALLTLADKYAPGVWNIGSDGKGDDWLEGVILAAQACNGEAVSPIKPKQPNPLVSKT